MCNITTILQMCATLEFREEIVGDPELTSHKRDTSTQLHPSIPLPAKGARLRKAQDHQPQP